MSRIEGLLQRIDGEKREYDQTIWPPATEETIDRLRNSAHETLKTQLPEGYITLLRRNDGVDFNGYVVYGATEHREPFLSGFIEANDRLGEPTPRFIFYAETGHTLYAHDRTHRRWIALDVPSLDVIDEFDSFDIMLERVLREALEE
ncbi:SMI1/KNR4 family protein [Granulicella sp. WH15]|uniref:YrhA family protein n=1 Tax=Granulicella sp. WH15 TaxID=2602070 RepID=UPI00136796F7|nr:YrhA family protein [Granulicella sp. WH15]QHN03663.1 SMI1/KNR4 family protein [Granulicella sp. WH15]